LLLITSTGKIHMLMPEEHDPRRDGGVDAKASGSEHMGHIVEVHGTAASVNGYRGVFVLGLTKQRDKPPGLSFRFSMVPVCLAGSLYSHERV
jgi:hypothetical protein